MKKTIIFFLLSISLTSLADCPFPDYFQSGMSPEKNKKEVKTINSFIKCIRQSGHSAKLTKAQNKLKSFYKENEIGSYNDLQIYTFEKANIVKKEARINYHDVLYQNAIISANSSIITEELCEKRKSVYISVVSKSNYKAKQKKQSKRYFSCVPKNPTNENVSDLISKCSPNNCNNSICSNSDFNIDEYEQIPILVAGIVECDLLKSNKKDDANKSSN